MLRKIEDAYKDPTFKDHVIAHLIRDENSLLFAKSINFNTASLVASEIAGLRYFKVLADIPMKAGHIFQTKAQFMLYLRAAKKTPDFEGVDFEQLDEFVDWVFSETMNTAFMKANLAKYVEYISLNKFFSHKLETAQEVKHELNKIIRATESANLSDTIDFASPFAQVHIKRKSDGIRLNLEGVDNETGGIKKGECAMILAPSGSGKTLVGSHAALAAATGGHKVLYISAEEPKINIINRWYANKLDMSYGRLHKGEYSETEIDMQMKALKSVGDGHHYTVLQENLRVVDVRQVANFSSDSAKNIIERFAENGFIPSLVIIDQMDYVRMNAVSTNKQIAQWEVYAKVAFELDELSHHKIQEKHEFALVVLHQASGQPEWSYSVNKIASFKGVIKPFDLVIGIGRKDQFSSLLNIFSLKSRHSGNFKHSYTAVFDNMRVVFTPGLDPANEEADEDREEDDNGNEIPKKRRGRPKGSKNMSRKIVPLVNPTAGSMTGDPTTIPLRPSNN